MLELTRHDSLAMKVGDFLDLQGTLKSGGVLSTTSEKKQALLVLELLAELLDGLVELEHLLELIRDLEETFDDLLSPLLLGCTILGKRECEHDHADELRCVRLGRGHTDFGTGVDVDTAVGEQRDGGTDVVDNTDGEGTTLQAVAESHERICGLTRLGDEDACVVTEHGRLTIQEIRGELDSDGDFSQLLEDTADSHARVEGGTAGDEDDPSASPDGGHVLAKTTKGDSLLDRVETSTHGVDDGLGLLEDFLLHEVVEAALHDLLKLDLQGLDGTNVGHAVVLVQAVDVERALVDVGDVVVLKVQDLLGVLDDGGGVGREEELGGHGHAIVGKEGAGLRAVEKRLVRGSEQVVAPLQGNVLRGALGREGSVLVSVLNIDEVDLHLLLGADTHDQGRSLAGSNHLVGVVHRLHEQTKGTLELLDDRLGELHEAEVRVLIVDVFGELGNGLGIGLRLELEALALEQHLQLLVVCDDAVVHDGELPVGVGPAETRVSPAHSVWRILGDVRGPIGAPIGFSPKYGGLLQMGRDGR